MSSIELLFFAVTRRNGNGGALRGKLFDAMAWGSGLDEWPDGRSLLYRVGP